MLFLNFKDFLLHKEYEEEEIDNLIDQLANSGVYDLHHNILFSNKRYPKYISEENLNAKMQKELNKELGEIFKVFLPCVNFLGPNRMKKIIEAINHKLTKPSKQIKKDANGNPITNSTGNKEAVNDYNRTREKAKKYNQATDAEKAEIDKEYKDLQIATYKLCIRIAKTKDETGRDGVKLALNHNRIDLVNEGMLKKFGEWILKCLKAIFGKPQNGKEADEDKVEKMFKEESVQCDPKAPDDEKKEKGVTWAKNVTNNDIKIMNFKDANAMDSENDPNEINKDVDTKLVKKGGQTGMKKYQQSFFKSIVLLSLKFGPASLNYLMDAVGKNNKSN